MPSVATLYDSLRVRTDGAAQHDRVHRRPHARRQRPARGQRAAGRGPRRAGRPRQPAAPRSRRPSGSTPSPSRSCPRSRRRRCPPTIRRPSSRRRWTRSRGPFGLRLGELRLGTDPAAGLEVVVEGFASEVPNVGASEDRVRLFVDSVKGAGGQELLRPEACGRERNNQPADFKSAGGKRLQATKTVRLIAGADPKALQSLTGRVQLRLPTRTEVVALAHPASGATVDRYGAVFTVTGMEGGRVSYQIAGARGRLLLFRALNAKGQPLASPSAFSSDFMFGEGVSGQRQYSGTVDRLEVVFAAEEETLELPFTLTDFAPAGKPSGLALDRTPAFRPYSSPGPAARVPAGPRRRPARALRALARPGAIVLRHAVRSHPAEPGGPELRARLLGRAAPPHPRRAQGRQRAHPARGGGGEPGRGAVEVGERGPLHRRAQGRAPLDLAEPLRRDQGQARGPEVGAGDARPCSIPGRSRP